MSVKTDFRMAYHLGYDDALAKRRPNTATAESFAAYYDHITADNVRLLELCKEWREYAYKLFDEFVGEPEANDDFMALEDGTRELRVEVNG